MADYTITLDADPSQVLQAFRQLEQQAKTAGESAGKKLAEGLQGFSSNSIAALQQELSRLQQRQLKVDVDSRAFTSLSGQIRQTQQQLAELEKRRVSIDTKPAVDQFRLLDGVIQGVAFSLSNAAVNGAQQAAAAIGGLVSGYARLDTEIRQAAAAGGGAGDYEKLASAIDKVGIDAAGTQQQVAGLTTALVRGGMTTDQVTVGLAGIVRGAEATATSYERMGEIVSATLTSFGLNASETTRVVDALVQGANSSATDVSGLGEAFKSSAPAAKLLGISVEGLATAVGLLTNAGITAGEAGTTLRNGLSLLGSAAPQTGKSMAPLTGQAKDAAEAMKLLGLDIYTSTGQLKPMDEVLLKLKATFDKLSKADKITMASRLFGGLDDANKWLAMLSQSEDKIKAMGTSMANAQGATDRNRDAMQGFQLTLQQLTGTIDSLGNQVGMVAAAALLPLVQGANALVGAVAGLPAPVKQTAIALGLLTGAVVGATTAYVVFQRAIAMTATQEAIAATVSLAQAIGGKLSVAATAGIGALQALYAAIKGLTFQSVLASVDQVVAVIKTQLASAVSAAATAFGSLVNAIKSGALVSLLKAVAIEFDLFVSGLIKFAAAVAPLAIALVIGAQAFAGYNEAAARSKKANDEVNESLQKLRDELVKTDIKARDSRNFFQWLFDSFKEGAAVITDSFFAEKLSNSLEAATKGAKEFYDTLARSSEVTEKQRTQAVAWVAALDASRNATQNLIKNYSDLAKEAKIAGDNQRAEVYTNMATALQKHAEKVDGLSTKLKDKIKITAEDIAQSGVATDSALKRADAERQLGLAIASQPIGQLDSRVAIGQQLLSQSRALSEAEQSRFSITKSALQFEMQKAQERGASEQEIGRIKRQIDQQDQAALSARYTALRTEQQLQMQMLSLTQEKARLEADAAIRKEQADLAKMKTEKVSNSDEKAALDARIQAQELVIDGKRREREILDQIQPIEVANARLTAQIALSGEQARAAAMGLKIAADGSLAPLSALEGATRNVATFTAQGSKDAALFNDIAANTGLVVSKAADGTVVLGQNWQAVNGAVAELNRGVAGVTDAAGKAAAGAQGISGALGSAQTPAQQLAAQFLAAGNNAPAAVQAAKGFTAAIEGAAGYGSNIKNLKLDTYFGGVAKSTGDAAKAAESFYGWLQRAAAIPAARWSGGPVEAGEAYRVNELGQEALWAGGRLSMIDAPANSIWRAPADGVVIPAGITARIQARSAVAVPAGGAPAGVADLAIEIGKLREEVGALARRDWSVFVQQRTGPSGSQVLRTLLR